MICGAVGEPQQLSLTEVSYSRKRYIYIYIYTFVCYFLDDELEAYKLMKTFIRSSGRGRGGQGGAIALQFSLHFAPRRENLGIVVDILILCLFAPQMFFCFFKERILPSNKVIFVFFFL